MKWEVGQLTPVGGPVLWEMQNNQSSPQKHLSFL